jgi:hypothetical protein
MGYTSTTEYTIMTAHWTDSHIQQTEQGSFISYDEAAQFNGVHLTRRQAQSSLIAYSMCSLNWDETLEFIKGHTGNQTDLMKSTVTLLIEHNDNFKNLPLQRQIGIVCETLELIDQDEIYGVVTYLQLQNHISETELKLQQMLNDQLQPHVEQIRDIRSTVYDRFGRVGGRLFDMRLKLISGC